MSLAGRIRIAAKQLRTFRVRDLADTALIKTYHERRSIRSTIRDFVRRGEMERIDVGLFRYIQLPKKVTIRQRLWNVVRRLKSPLFSLDDLERFTEAKRETISDFCKWLVNSGYAERVKPGHFKRIGRLEPIVPASSKKA